MRTMKAAVLYQVGSPLVIEELEVPYLGHGQVLVRVVASGVCHSQLHEVQGEQPDPFLPHLLGHEGAGVVEAVGPGVTTVKVEDHVVLSWIQGAGIQSKTPTYRKGMATINAGWITTFNEYTVASENRVTPVRKDMPLDKAALLGCAVPTGAGAMFHQADVQPSHTVAVFGVGGIGLNAVQAASFLGARMVIAVDMHDAKLQLAREFGATEVVNAREQDPVCAIKELTIGNGADITFEASGRTEVMEQAYEAARPRSGLTIISGVPPRDAKIRIDSYQLNLGKRIMGTAGGASNPSEDYPKYADLYLSGKWKLDELITHRFQLAEVNDALAALANGEVGRGIIESDSVARSEAS